MPHTQVNKSQIARRSQMNKSDLMKATRDSRPRDDIRTAYDGDENKGPAQNQKHEVTHRRKTKGRRLRAGSAKTPKR